MGAVVRCAVDITALACGQSSSLNAPLQSTGRVRAAAGEDPGARGAMRGCLEGRVGCDCTCAYTPPPTAVGARAPCSG
eukprot:306551-Prymnesium_polylepis.1